MNKKIIVNSLLTGSIIFIIYLRESFSPGQGLNIKLLPMLYLYYATKQQLKYMLVENSLYEIKFKETFIISMKICLSASLFASILYFIVPDFAKVQYTASKLIRNLDVFFGPMIIGTISSLIIAGILVKTKISVEKVEVVSKTWLKWYAVSFIGIILLVYSILYLITNK